MNVLAKIGYDNSTVEIEFPIDDDELDRTLKQNYMPTDTTKPFLVRDIDYPTVPIAVNCCVPTALWTSIKPKTVNGTMADGDIVICVPAPL